MTRTFRRLFTLLGVAFLVAPSAASAQSYANTVWDQLKRGYESNQGQGFASRKYIMGRMNDDASDTWSFALTAGMTYKFWGVCDGDCSDLDIALLDENNNELESDVLTDDNPIVEYRPKKSGTYKVKVTMAACSTNPCFWGFAIFQK